jgi:hypothetical protein
LSFGLRLGRFAANALVVLGIVGCATQVSKDPASPYSRVPVDSILTIHHKIEVPPGRSRVFFQNGRVAMAFNRYAPNCNIEVSKIDHQNRQYVEPGQYRVYRVQMSTEQIVRGRPLRLAALGLTLADLGSDGGEGTPMIYEGYHLWLESADPHVRRVSCRGALADPPVALPPSIEEIRQSLGDIMTLSLAKGTP